MLIVGPGTTSAVYSRRDYDAIASTLREPVEAVLGHAQEFEEAAFWYTRFEPNPLDRKASALRTEAEKIGRAAQKLLRVLGVDDIRAAPDGPAPRILELLTYGDNAEERLIVNATDRIGKLAEICNGIAAAKEIALAAQEASPGIQKLADAMGLTGHGGDQAFEMWLGSMMSLFSRITGFRPKMNVGASGRLDEGIAGGMLLEFVAAVGGPLGIERSSDALRSKARAVLKHSPPRK